MLFRTSCGHVTRHRNSRVRREADAACKPLRRGYKVVTAIWCKSSKNFTNTPKKRRFFCSSPPWRLCRAKGVAAGATREQEWGMRAPGERSGSRAGVRMGRDHAGAKRDDEGAKRDDEGAGRDDVGAERGGIMRKPGGTTREPNRALRGPDGACAGRGRCGGALRRRGQCGAFPAERGVLGGK